MNEKEILALAKASDCKRISHPRNPESCYVVLAVVKLHCDDGEWRLGVRYWDPKSDQDYCRRADDFGKFSECK